MNQRSPSSMTFVYLIVCMFFFGAVACEKEESEWPQGKEIFETPPWLGGTNIETLEKDSLERFTIFLELMTKANYKTPIEKQLFTLFVPENTMFEEYFKSVGKTGVDDLTEDEAVQLFTLHVLRNPRSRYHLIYEYAWGEEQGPDGEYAALFFRKPTTSFTLPTVEIPKYHPTKAGLEMLVISENKNLPIFSTDYFEDYFGTLDGSDYSFMYRESKWGNNLNIHDAMVTKAEVKTANGFIYFLDKVIEPMPNIDEYLRDEGEEFSVFYDLMQRFAEYSFAKTRQTDKMKLYRKNYKNISNLAAEGGPFGEDLPRKMKEMFTLFAPTNETLNKYLEENILNSYESIDSVPEITLIYLIENQISWNLALISKIESSFFDAQGDPSEISRNDIESAHMCSNGLIYGTNRLLEPNVFTTVPSKLFFDKDYSTFLYCISAIGAMGRLSDVNEDVTLFAVNNEQMEAYNIRYNKDKNSIQYKTSDGLWGGISYDLLLNFVLDHIYLGKLSDISGDGFIQMESKNYVHYNNNTLTAGKNVAMGDEANVIKQIENDKNGFLYLLDNPIKAKYTYGEFIANDPDLEEFKNLLVVSNMLDLKAVDAFTEDTIPSLRFVVEQDYWTAFAPTNNAVIDARNKGILPIMGDSIRASAIDSIKTFCNYHFLRKNVIFDDGLTSGEFSSNLAEVVDVNGTIYSKLTVNNRKNNLQVTDLSGQTVTVNHSDANNLVERGVIHKIPTALIKPLTN